MKKRSYTFLAGLLFILVLVGSIPATATAKKNKITKETAQTYVKPIDVELDGVSYTIPFKYEELVKNGWKPENPEDETGFGSLSTYQGYVMVKDGKSINVDFINLNPTYEEINEATVYSVRGDINIFKVTNKITSKMKREKVEEMYGEPHVEIGVTKDAVMKYDDGSSWCSYLDVDREIEDDYIARYGIEVYYSKKGKVERVNATSLYFDIAAMLEENEKLAKDQYQAPKKLTNDPLSFHFELDGSLYSLPVSLQELAKDGWDYKEEYKYVNAHSNYGMTFSKDGKFIDTMYSNNYDVAMKTKYCDVTSLEIDGNTTAKVVMPGKITIGSTEKQLLKAYKGQTYEVIPRDRLIREYQGGKDSEAKCYRFYKENKNVSSNKYHPYETADVQGQVDFIVIDGKVTHITMTYMPNSIYYTREDLLIPEKKVKITSKKDAVEFFCFNETEEYSIWSSGEDERIGFTKDGHFYIEWNGSDVIETSPTETYTLDVKKNLILYKNREKTTKIPYKILSSESIAVTYQGKTKIFRTGYLERLYSYIATTSDTLYVNKKAELMYSGVVPNAKITGITSSNRRIATVNAAGQITPLRPGKVTITVTVKQYGRSEKLSKTFVVKKAKK